jgi:hypothetical protein
MKSHVGIEKKIGKSSIPLIYFYATSMFKRVYEKNQRVEINDEYLRPFIKAPASLM